MTMKATWDVISCRNCFNFGFWTGIFSASSIEFDSVVFLGVHIALLGVPLFQWVSGFVAANESFFSRGARGRCGRATF